MSRPQERVPFASRNNEAVSNVPSWAQASCGDPVIQCTSSSAQSAAVGHPFVSGPRPHAVAGVVSLAANSCASSPASALDECADVGDSASMIGYDDPNPEAVSIGDSLFTRCSRECSIAEQEKVIADLSLAVESGRFRLADVDGVSWKSWNMRCLSRLPASTSARRTSRDENSHPPFRPRHSFQHRRGPLFSMLARSTISIKSFHG